MSQQAYTLAQFVLQEVIQLFVMCGILEAPNTSLEQLVQSLLLLLQYLLVIAVMSPRSRILETNTSLKRKHASTFMSEAKTGPQLFTQ